VRRAEATGAIRRFTCGLDDENLPVGMHALDRFGKGLGRFACEF
jgi:hypothetical protein